VKRLWCEGHPTSEDRMTLWSVGWIGWLFGFEGGSEDGLSAVEHSEDVVVLWSTAGLLKCIGALRKLWGAVEHCRTVEVQWSTQKTLGCCGALSDC
jgi:hypothetical protein